MAKTKNLHIGRKIVFYKTLWQGVPEKERCCYYCRAILTLSTRTLDHLMPRARGGTNNIKNVVLCCRPCNNAKADLTVAEFVEFCALSGGIMKVRELYGDNPASRLDTYLQLLQTQAA